MSRDTRQGSRPPSMTAFSGVKYYYFMHLDSGQKVESIQESTIDSIILQAPKFLYINTDKVNLFTADGSANILKGVSNDGDGSATLKASAMVVSQSDLC